MSRSLLGIFLLSTTIIAHGQVLPESFRNLKVSSPFFGDIPVIVDVIDDSKLKALGRPLVAAAILAPADKDFRDSWLGSKPLDSRFENREVNKSNIAGWLQKGIVVPVLIVPESEIKFAKPEQLEISRRPELFHLHDLTTPIGLEKAAINLSTDRNLRVADVSTSLAFDTYTEIRAHGLADKKPEVAKIIDQFENAARDPSKSAVLIENSRRLNLWAQHLTGFPVQMVPEDVAARAGEKLASLIQNYGLRSEPNRYLPSRYESMAPKVTTMTSNVNPVVDSKTTDAARAKSEAPASATSVQGKELLYALALKKSGIDPGNIDNKTAVGTSQILADAVAKDLATKGFATTVAKDTNGISRVQILRAPGPAGKFQARAERILGPYAPKTYYDPIHGISNTARLTGIGSGYVDTTSGSLNRQTNEIKYAGSTLEKMSRERDQTQVHEYRHATNLARRKQGDLGPWQGDIVTKQSPTAVAAYQSGFAADEIYNYHKDQIASARDLARLREKSTSSAVANELRINAFSALIAYNGQKRKLGAFSQTVGDSVNGVQDLAKKIDGVVIQNVGSSVAHVYVDQYNQAVGRLMFSKESNFGTPEVTIVYEAQRDGKKVASANGGKAFDAYVVPIDHARFESFKADPSAAYEYVRNHILSLNQQVRQIAESRAVRNERVLANVLEIRKATKSSANTSPQVVPVARTNPFASATANSGPAIESARFLRPEVAKPEPMAKKIEVKKIK